MKPSRAMLHTGIALGIVLMCVSAAVRIYGTFRGIMDYAETMVNAAPQNPQAVAQRIQAHIWHPWLLVAIFCLGAVLLGVSIFLRQRTPPGLPSLS